MNDNVALAEAADRLGRNRELVRQWLSSGRLAGRKRAGGWFVESRGAERVPAPYAHEESRRASSAAGGMGTPR